MRKTIITISCALLCCGAWAQEIFNSVVVRQTDGHVATFSLQQVESISVSTQPATQQNKWFWMLESPGIADYLRDFDYNPRNYSYHNIFNYRGEPYLDEHQDWPYGVTLGDTTYYNLIPGRRYQLSPLENGRLTDPLTIQTLGQLRLIRTESIDNVRDLGGWPTGNGHHVKYGCLYRGTELNTMLSPNYTALHSPHQLSVNDRNILRHELGIGAELDLRGNGEIPSTGSPLGEDIVYKQCNISYTNIDTSDNRLALLQCFQFLLNQLRAQHGIYIHCVWGADRTGMLCLFIEGLLGMKQSDLDKEYELTSFTGNSRFRTNNYYQSALNIVLSRPGNTLQQKFRSWWLECGATEPELDEFVLLLTE